MKNRLQYAQCGFDLAPPAPNPWLGIPGYLVDTLRALVGDRSSVRNATAIFMGNDRLRDINEVGQLARFEYAARFSSQAVRNVLFNIQPDMTEFEAVELMKLSGLPLSCQRILSVDKRALMGLPSPSSRRIALGAPSSSTRSGWSRA